jgi:hypothetical protein
MGASELLYPQWQNLVLRAVMEIKPDSLMEKIQTAEKAIPQRLRELEGNPGWKEERVALHNAVQTLRALKRGLIQSDNLEVELEEAQCLG